MVALMLIKGGPLLAAWGALFRASSLGRADAGRIEPSLETHVLFLHALCVKISTKRVNFIFDADAKSFSRKSAKVVWYIL